MARQSRIISKTDFYHIIMRGNNKAYIFESGANKRYFRDAVDALEAEGELKMVAWCLMDNHVHLVVKVEPDRLDNAFKRLNIKYAMYWHRLTETTGHVFQGRFKSEPIESKASMRNVIRYVHNNPVKAKMVARPELYGWSSYNSYVKGMRRHEMDLVWQLFGGLKSFETFHGKEDNREYLEIKEDLEIYRAERVQKVKAEIKRKYLDADGTEIFKKSEILQEAVRYISENCCMSAKQIAELVGVSESTVQRIRKKLG